jgi:hypothetical protein
MSDKPKCGACGSTDFTPGGKCRPCKKKRNDAYREKRAKAAGGGSTVKPKAKSATLKSNGAPVELVIDPCFGFEARITAEGFLEVQQRNNEGEVSDTLVVSRTEFRQLIDKFSGWATA